VSQSDWVDAIARTAGGLVKVHVDTLELEIRVTVIGARGVDAVLVADNLPELSSDLVAALAGLNVYDLTHRRNAFVSFDFEAVEPFGGTPLVFLYSVPMLLLVSSSTLAPLALSPSGSWVMLPRHVPGCQIFVDSSMRLE
jgi:hypothetical protein